MKLIRPVAATLGIVMMIGLTGCKNEPVKHVSYNTDDYVIEHYTEGLEGIKSNEYETIVYTLKYFDMGPHESTFRGIIYFDEDAAEELWEKYEWKEVEETTFEFDKVDIGDADSKTWYRSYDFEKDAFKMIAVRYACFDGEKIIYSINQT